jgi:hypothetical protein
LQETTEVDLQQTTIFATKMIQDLHQRRWVTPHIREKNQEGNLESCYHCHASVDGGDVSWLWWGCQSVQALSGLDSQVLKIAQTNF